MVYFFSWPFSINVKPRHAVREVEFVVPIDDYVAIFPQSTANSLRSGFSVEQSGIRLVNVVRTKMLDRMHF